MTRSFGLDAYSALEELKSYVEKFIEDDLNQSLARDCACKAWHLCDHVFLAFNSTSQFVGLSNFQAHIRCNCPELGFLQDVCTATKHGEIKRYLPRIVEARHHEGDFSREDFNHDDFDVDRFEITLPNGRTVSFRKLLNRALYFWCEFFKNYEIK